MDSGIQLSKQRTPLMARVTGAFVYIFERLLPEPFVFAVLLTQKQGVTISQAFALTI